MNNCTHTNCRNDAARSRVTSPWHGLCEAHAELARRAHRRATRVTETPEYTAMLRRQVANMAQRAMNQGDVYDLGDLAAMAASVDAALLATMTAYRAQGFTWAQIGDALSMTKQGAQQRFKRLGGAL